MYVLVLGPQGRRDPSSPARDATGTPCIGWHSLNQWAAVEVSSHVVFAGVAIWWGRLKAKCLPSLGILELKLKKGQQGTLGHVATLFIKVHTPGHLQENYLGIFLVNNTLLGPTPDPHAAESEGTGGAAGPSNLPGVSGRCPL